MLSPSCTRRERVMTKTREPNIIFHHSSGTFRFFEAPLNVQWLMDLLAFNFGWENVRLGLPENYGQIREAGVVFKDGKGFGFRFAVVDLETLDFQETVIKQIREWKTSGVPRDVGLLSLGRIKEIEEEKHEDKTE